MSEVFEGLLTARWEVGDRSIRFAVVRVRESKENRLVQHKRLYREGARLDDTFGNARIWQLTAEFFNDPDHQEPGLDRVQYPDNVNALCDSFDIHETGNLVTPTRGTRRCRAHRYERIEEAGERDVAAVVFTFIEDNEDDERAAVAAQPSAVSAAEAMAADAFAACTDAGAFDDDVGSIANFAADLVALAQAPQSYADDLERKARAYRHRLGAVERAFSEAVPTPLLGDPVGARALLHLRELSDTVARLHGERFEQHDRVVERRFAAALSLMDLAAQLQQPFEQLMHLNEQLPNLLWIAPGTPVRVFGTPRTDHHA